MRYDVYITEVHQRVPFAAAIRQFNGDLGLAEALDLTYEEILVYDVTESEKSQLEKLVGTSAMLRYEQSKTEKEEIESHREVVSEEMQKAKEWFKTLTQQEKEYFWLVAISMIGPAKG